MQIGGMEDLDRHIDSCLKRPICQRVKCYILVRNVARVDSVLNAKSRRIGIATCGDLGVNVTLAAFGLASAHTTQTGTPDQRQSEGRHAPYGSPKLRAAKMTTRRLVTLSWPLRGSALGVRCSYGA